MRKMKRFSRTGLVVSALAIAAMAAAVAMRDSGSPPTATVHAERSYVVPPLPNPPRSLNIRPVRPQRWEGNDQIAMVINAAVDIMQSVRSRPSLQSGDDFRIFALLDRAKEKPFRVTTLSGQIAEAVVFGYSCVDNRFYIGAYQHSPAMLAIVYYHELMHMVDCEREMEKRAFVRHEQMQNVQQNISRCNMEASAHAAAIRMFLAIWESDGLPREVAMGAGAGDLVGDIQMSWTKLLEGDDRFCTYLKEKYGSDAGFLTGGDRW